jgi:hypothetical protein
MRVLTSSVLVFEIILIVLLIPTILAFENKNQVVLITLSIIIIIFAVLAMGLMKKSIGLILGWIVQGTLFVIGGFVGLGFFAGVIWILAAIFTVLWYLAIRLGRKADQQKAANLQNNTSE